MVAVMQSPDYTRFQDKGPEDRFPGGMGLDSATLLRNGQVLVAGGADSADHVSNAAEIYQQVGTARPMLTRIQDCPARVAI